MDQFYLIERKLCNNCLKGYTQLHHKSGEVFCNLCGFVTDFHPQDNRPDEEFKNEQEGEIDQEHNGRIDCSSSMIFTSEGVKKHKDRNELNSCYLRCLKLIGKVL